jgi:[protein-PII] uridylyltransferase
MALPAEDASTVLFLIGAHLEVSSTLRRRDIFDPATIRELAAKLATPEQLKMLTLMTLADIQAVNPDALTRWKAENLWRLYMSTSAYFDRSADEHNLGADHAARVAAIVTLLPNHPTEAAAFLEGFPQRYFLSHTPQEVAQHFTMAACLNARSVQLALRAASGQQELTLITRDRPGLFCTVAGILYGWGMNITKAAAFSNHAGIVVDCFYFTDRFHTLELNPPECERFQRSIREILCREAPLEPLLQSRLKADQKAVKLTVDTRLRHDNESSQRSTLLEVVTQDRPGLLHTIASVLSTESYSIEVALIDTEGPVAHDVFYLTSGGQKLSPAQCRDLEWAISTELGDFLPPTW